MSGDWNALALSRILVLVSVSLLILLFPCEFGEWMAGRFDAFNDDITQWKWYLFSIELQRMYLILLAQTQQPGIICSFGNIPCKRDSFKRVWISCGELIFSKLFVNDCFFSQQIANASFSYFMTLRRIYR